MKIKTSRNSIHISNVHNVTLNKEANIRSVANHFNIIYFPDTTFFMFEGGHWSRAIKIMAKMAKSIFVEVLSSSAISSTWKITIWYTDHHGARPGHSTASVLIQMYDTWVQEVEEGNMVGVMMIDLSAAFDMVDYDILLKKRSYWDWMRQL